MYPRHSGSLFDDFLGAAVFADRYVIDDTNGTVALVDAGPDKIDGVLALSPGPDLGDFVEVYTDPEAFTRWGRARFFAKFRLPKIDNVLFELGFRFDLSNYVVLKVNTDTDFDWHFEAKAGGAATTQDLGGHIDTDWHTVEIRLLGGTGAAELVIDADEANKLTIADANLPDKPLFLWAYAEMLQTYAGQTRDLLLDYWGAHQQTDPANVETVTAPGGGDAITAMGQYNGRLVVGRGSAAAGAKARQVQQYGSDGTWTDLGTPSATAGMVRCLCNFDGELYAGHDDEAKVYEWISGTTWADVGTLTGATGCAHLIHWQDAALSDYLYAGTIGTPAKVMNWDGVTTWSDLSDAGWPSGAAAITLCVHDGKLFAYHGGNGKVYEYTGTGTTWTDRGTPGGSSATTTPARMLASFKGALYAFDPENNAVYRWDGVAAWGEVLAMTGDPAMRAVCSDGLLYHVERASELLRRTLDGDNWETVADLSALTSPTQIATGDGVIFVGDDAGAVRALR
jgi:hypothetical protein